MSKCSIPIWCSFSEHVTVSFAGLQPGTAIVITPLVEADLSATYGSDASTKFISFVEDPAKTQDKVQRLLVNRYKHQEQNSMTEGQIMTTFFKWRIIFVTWKRSKILIWRVDFSYFQGIRTILSQTFNLVNLYFRVKFENFTAFSLAVVGNVPMPGPIIITYPDEVGINSTGNRPMLLHWNPCMSNHECNEKNTDA